MKSTLSRASIVPILSPFARTLELSIAAHRPGGDRVRSIDRTAKTHALPRARERIPAALIDRFARHAHPIACATLGGFRDDQLENFRIVETHGWLPFQIVCMSGEFKLGLITSSKMRG